jgi:hypothetical protein
MQDQDKLAAALLEAYVAKRRANEEKMRADELKKRADELKKRADQAFKQAVQKTGKTEKAVSNKLDQFPDERLGQLVIDLTIGTHICAD